MLQRGNSWWLQRTKSIEDKEYSIPTKELDPCVLDTCRICEDFSSQLADVSAGSAGSLDGCTSLIIRTKVGGELVSISERAIQTKKLDEEGRTKPFQGNLKNLERLR
ncbi:MAG: Coenzyme F420 hydrogenase/dehydrogenase, beta subunit C-terminal domain [Methanophagales archaeon]|nr:Coenzyme F420 hydrogenase/dehydrogenase, beta subunit C-terminal domain [Methanophagales archaeon]